MINARGSIELSRFSEELIRIEEKIGNGYYSLNDLVNYLNYLYSIYRRYGLSSAKKRVETVFSSEEACRELLRISVKESEEMFRSLARYEELIGLIGSILLKSYVLSAIISNGEQYIHINPRYVIGSLTHVHRLISIYNPVTLFYIAYRYPDKYLEYIIKPVHKRTVLYEFNPLIINTVLYRDLVVLYGILRNTDIYNYLLEKYIGEKTELDLKSEQVYNEYYHSTVINSYFRVVKAVSESIRAIDRGLDKYVIVQKKIRDSLGSTLFNELFQQYILIYREYLNSIVNYLYNLLDSLISVSNDAVRTAILSSIDEALSINSIVEENIYVLLTFLYEASLFDDYLTRTTYSPYNIDLKQYREVYGKYVSKIVEVLEHVPGAVENILNNPGEPYVSLKNRIMNRKSHRYLSWITF